MLCLAHGKMYKRYTFGSSCPSLRSRYGIVKDIKKGIDFSKLRHMKKQENEVRNKMVVIRMNNTEFEKIETLRKKTTERYLSSYVRKRVLEKPVMVKYRNQSADDFLREMLGLKNELNGIGNNFNQAVHKLHMLEKIPEFRVWVNHYDGLHKSLVSKVEEIKLKVNQLYEQWLLK